jgi:hypothetical protein
MTVFLFTVFLGLAFSGESSLDGAFVIGRYAVHSLPFVIGNIYHSLQYFDK